MISANSTIEERMSVWTAMSELFLDTELQEEDHLRIARVLAASTYSEEKLEEILRFEVTPALKGNLLCVAGEWAGFDEEWLRETIAPRLERRPLFRFGVHWIVRDHWKEIVAQITHLRTK
jgi:hypothetical protein